MDEKQRRSIRLAGYDYAQGGAYFVTVCTHERKCVFGRIENGAMRPNVYGNLVRDEWLKSAELRLNVVLDEFQIMPNHFHAIVIFTERGSPSVGAHCNAPVLGPRAHCNAPLQRPARSLASLVGGFKGSVTRNINLYRAGRNLAPVRVWQRNYFERIVRDEKELDDTRCYINENPLAWLTDENYSGQ